MPSRVPALTFPKGPAALTYPADAGASSSLTLSTVQRELLPPVPSPLSPAVHLLLLCEASTLGPTPIPLQVPWAWLPGWLLFSTSVALSFWAPGFPCHPIYSPSNSSNRESRPGYSLPKTFPRLPQLLASTCRPQLPLEFFPACPVSASPLPSFHTCAQGSWTHCVLLPGLCT